MKELLQYTFFQHALAGSLLAGIICGLMGTYIVSRRRMFIVGGMAHASMGGVGICALLGFPPLWGAAATALLTGLAVEKLRTRREVREDSAIAMLWAFGMSIGVLCCFMAPGFLPNLAGYLFGNILLINETDLWLLGLLCAISLIVFCRFTPQIIACAFDREFARSQRLPVGLIDYGMTALTALTIVACLRVTGMVMILSLLSVPQMTANLFTRNFHSMAIWSVILATGSCLGGLMVSYYYNVPSGATFILLSIIIYLLLRTIKAVAFRFNRR